MLDIKSYRGKYSVEFISLENIPKIENSIGIIDSKVLELYGDTLIPKVDQFFVVSASEENKTLDYCLDLINTLCDMGVKKNTTLVAMGGGVTQDITSFTASILYRGISWSFIPTTLLAQADSCIGSKTSINHNNVKNLVGSFYPPTNIWCDTEVLKSLDDSDIDSGIGEMLHYFMLFDSRQLSKIDKDNLTPSIMASLQIKKRMIQKDEFDQGERRIFNYGHTFGHALEVVSSYTLKHGLAVTMGMHLANYISYRFGFIPKHTLDYLQSKILFNMPNYKIEENIHSFIFTLLKDKKNTSKNLVCILPYGIKDFRVTTISDMERLQSYIEDWTEISL